MILNIIGFSAATLTMLSFIPQVIKVAKTKSARDVSLITLLQLSLGVSLWVVYGVLRRDLIIILANVVTLSILLVMLFFYFRYSQA
jgi:MtN3 and saliva related transmembrane protein